MFLNKIRNIFCVPETKLVSATNVARAGKPGYICVGNNVFTTMCPRLPGPLQSVKSPGIFFISVGGNLGYFSENTFFTCAYACFRHCICL